jgi:two-component system NtrC family sensor kinase
MVSMLERAAVGMGETILTSTHSSMLANDQTHLRQIVESIGRSERVLALRIIDAHGEVRHSSHPEEIGQISSIEAMPCSGCHQEGQTRVPTSLKDGLQIYPVEGGQQTLGLGFPVLNSVECSGADCHVHPEDQRVLGILDLELSTVQIEQDIAAAGRQMLVFAIITILAICLLIGLLAWRLVHRPIHALLDGTHRLARGELFHRIETSTSTELGDLATSFNVMTSRLQKAHEDLEEWSRTLEQRVADKTRELEQTRDQMIFAEKMASLGKLAAIVAHEINNPLAGVLIYTKLVRRRLPKLIGNDDEKKTKDSTEIAETLASMEQEMTRCGDLVNNLLLFSRRREASMAPEDVNAILERSVRLVRHQADLQEVGVVVDLDPSLPKATCDASQIEQATLAVIINAIEAMPDGGTLTIRTRHRPASDDVGIEISDTGVGIPEELRTKIFEPFFSTKSEGKGTGLGLSVMYGIIQQHEGRVEFTSDIGAGTTFIIDLPIHPKAEAEFATADAPAKKEEA